ncbi:MAG: zinc ribbon domain-containing protein [Pseudomonadota bacterium]
MPTASELGAAIDALGIDKRQLLASTAEQAKDQIRTIRSLQGELRSIKRTANLEMKTIRAAYRDKIANAGSVTGGIFSLFGKRGLAGNLRADAKRATRRDRDRDLAPFEDLKLYIDNLLAQLADAKNQFDAYLGELKIAAGTERPSRDSKGPSSGQFCTSCGKRVGKTHKFCASCGKKIERGST